MGQEIIVESRGGRSNRGRQPSTGIYEQNRNHLILKLIHVKNGLTPSHIHQIHQKTLTYAAPMIKPKVDKMDYLEKIISAMATVEEYIR